MKPILTVAIVAATLVIVFLSCNLFGPSKEAKRFDVTGSWVIDSIDNRSTDTSVRNLGLLVLSLDKDSLPLTMIFEPDGSYHFLNSSDSLRGRYRLLQDSAALMVAEQDKENELRFGILNSSDSAFTLMSPDSLVYFLSRK
ncbi:MAG TPA: hypothetical protein VF145_12500 [Chitinophagaceae bacterium]